MRRRFLDFSLSRRSRLSRLPALLLSLSAATAAVVACGGISDPSKDRGESVATVRGRLTSASVPEGARVALVWRTNDASRVHISADVPVVDGAFSMTVGMPPANTFAPVHDDGDVAEPFDDPPPPGSSTSGSGGWDDTPSSSSSGSSGGSSSGGSSSGGSTSSSGGMPSGAGLRPQNQLNGSVVTEELTAAAAGFVIYVDTNGNGQLDINLDDTLSTPDTIVGGNRELTLLYLKGGGAFAYEKLRDRAGVLPEPGVNLFWAEGERFMLLSAVELGLRAHSVLPGLVCGGVTKTSMAEPSTPPELECSPDGRSYTYKTSPCESAPATPAGLCGGSDGSTCPPAGGGGPTALLPGEDPPPWWPCPIGGHEPIDAGPGPDMNGIDAGSP